MDIFAMLEGGVDPEESIKPALPWPGNKLRSKDEILPYLPYGHAYIEPFGGTGAILLNRTPSEIEVWNDMDDGLVAFYRCLRDEALLLRLNHLIEFTLHSRREWEWCKATWQQPDDIVEKAFRWYYVINYSFASLGRNFGSATRGKNGLSGKIREREQLFWPIHRRVKRMIIENDDWETVARKYDGPDAVFYFDPPYVEGDQNAYGSASGNYLKIDHVKLIETIFELKGHVVLSGYPNDFYDQFPWDDSHEWMMASTITPLGENANKATRGKVKEKLWVKES